jgi:rubrerythrin
MSILPAGYPTTQPEAFALLSSRQKLSIDDMKMLALLEAAGEAFYFALADVAGSDEIKSLLRRNGQEERGHAHRLLKAMALLGEEYALPGDDQNPYVMRIPLDGMLNEQFLAMIEKSEMDGDLQYQKWADAETNAEVSKLFRQNGSEETRHGERVARVKELLG